MTGTHLEIVVIETPIFPLGQLVATPNALAHLTREEMLIALGRHANGDWGLLEADNKAANEKALIKGTRLISAYETAGKVRFWIITEADRSATTVLLPEDY
jgi:hypothetical protein